MSVSKAFRFTCDVCGRETKWGWIDRDLRAVRKDLAKKRGWSYRRLMVGGYVDLCEHCKGTVH